MKSRILLLCTFICVLLPSSVLAADFVSLVGIPGLTNNATDLNSYINALYRLSISIAALLAVIKIIAAGAKYMLTDIVPAKEEAKKDIQGALIGLLIVIGAIIILNTVNTDLTKVDFNLETVNLEYEDKTNPAAKLDACTNSEYGCFQQVCTDSINILPGISEFLPDSIEPTCKAHCDAVNGLFYKESETAVNRCAVDNKDLNPLRIAGKCPTGSKCVVEPCTIYGKNTNSCRGTCENKLGGYYIQKDQTCFLVDTEKNEAYTCNTEDTFVGLGGRGGTTIDKCVPAENKCLNDGGIVESKTDLSISCKMFKPLDKACNEIGDYWVNGSCIKNQIVKNNVCSDGYDCKIASCNVPDTFGFDESCQSWCNDDQRSTDIGFTGGEYNEQFNVCYVNLRESESNTSVNIKPNLVYRVNDPADPVNGVPNDSLNHNALITFVQPIKLNGGLVRVVINQREQWLGCKLINPPVCI